MTESKAGDSSVVLRSPIPAVSAAAGSACPPPIRKLTSMVAMAKEFAQRAVASMEAAANMLPQSADSLESDVPLPVRATKGRKRMRASSQHGLPPPPATAAASDLVHFDLSRLDAPMASNEAGLPPMQLPLPSPQYVSMATAEEQTGISRNHIKSWAGQSLINTLKPGSNSSHRLVDLGDLRRFIELKRESANAKARRELENEQQVGGNRTLIYVRADPPKEFDEANWEDEELTEEEKRLRFKPLQDKVDKIKKHLAGVFASSAVCQGLEFYSNKLDRPGFEALVMDQILKRKINRIVVSAQDQICPEDVWPLFAWLCQQHGVAILLVSVSAESSIHQHAQQVSAAAAAEAVNIPAE